MRIALQLGLNVECKRGLDTFYQGMTDGLGRADAENEYRLFAYFWKDYEAKRRALPQPPGPNFKLDARRWPSSAVDRLEQAGAPVIDRLFARPGRFDVYHGLGSRLPRVRAAKRVVTIHDLMPEVFWERARARGLDSEPRPTGLTGVAARRADRVIATSSGTRDDLVRVYGISPEKISVVLYGADDSLFHPAGDPRCLGELRARHGLRDPFLLFLGPFQPRHNSERVLEAAASLRREGLGRELGFVFAGKPDSGLDAVLARARALGLGPDLRALGYVPREDLPLLYEAAFAVAHPTTYGGGLPAYESLACGAVLLTSSTAESTMPEIVEDGALTVDPFRTEEIAGALARLLREPALGPRLREKALARGRKLTWRRAAEQYVRIYEELIRGVTPSGKGARRPSA